MSFRHFPRALVPAFLFLLGVAAYVISPSALATSHATTPTTQTMTEMVNGEVRKVDKDARKITLRHGEIKQLDMPAMTMVFQIKDPAILDKVKAGDRVKFRAQNEGGAFFLTEIEKIP